MHCIVRLVEISCMHFAIFCNYKICWPVSKGKHQKAERVVRSSPDISKQERRFNEKGMKNEVNDTKSGVPKGQNFNYDNTFVDYEEYIIISIVKTFGTSYLR